MATGKKHFGQESHFLSGIGFAGKREQRKKEGEEYRAERKVRDYIGGYERSPIIQKVMLPYRGSPEEDRQR